MRPYLPTDLDRYRDIGVLEARAYLTANGWSKTREFKDRAAVYTNPLSDTEILLPLKQSFADYAVRLYELVSMISDFENREIQSIFSDMIMSSFDVFRIRVVDNVKFGTLSLNSSPNIIDHAKDMLAAAASAKLNPLAVYGSRRPREVEAYIDQVRLGQTEIGSYVFTLLSPVVPVVSDTLALPFAEPMVLESDPFSREVVRKLDQALHATYEAAQATIALDSISPFNDAIEFGVNANFCEALSGIAKEAGTTSFSISWGSVRPIAKSTLKTSPTTFTIAMADIIEEAAIKLKEIAPRNDTLLTGYITGLEKDKRDPEGNVVMKAWLDGDYKVVKLMLDEEQYQAAILAHKAYKTVSVEGDLIQRGRYRYLTHVRNFHVVVDSE